MSTTTSRLALTQPAGTDAPSSLRTSITGNATILDNAVLITEGVVAARPAANTVEHGRFYKATDTGDLSYSNGTSWVSVAQVGTGSAAATYQSGTAAARPSAATVPAGTMYNATDTAQLSWSNGSAWAGLALPSVINNSTNFTATPWTMQVVTNTSPISVTLPTPSQSMRVGVRNGVSGGGNVTIIASSGTTISGLGSLGVSNISLSMVAAVVEFLYDPTYSTWQIVRGQPDTGWVTLTGNGSWTAAGGYTPAVRKIGDMCYLSGALSYPNSSGSSNPITYTTYPPAATVSAAATTGGGYGMSAIAVTIQTGGAVSTGPLTLGSGVGYVYLDGISYRAA